MTYEEIAKSKYAALAGRADTVILGIESSCDETAAAVVAGGRRILSNVIDSQADIHARYGGVVPEIASRNHTMAVQEVTERALKQAGLRISDVDAVAVTYGAGLIGALMVGVAFAKAFAFYNELPLVGVNHVEAHIAANYLEYPLLTPPFTGLIVSGGHTTIARVADYNDYRVLGSTTDDAIGEAFDKVARLLGLPYPGGASVDRLSAGGQNNIAFYKTQKTVKKDYSLSYSGLKTAVVNYLHNLEQKGSSAQQPLYNIHDVCASFTAQAVDLLVDTVLAAAKDDGSDKLVMAGGVACNSYLRKTLTERGRAAGLKVYYPSPALCTDNAAFVASRAFYSAYCGTDRACLSLSAKSSLKPGERL